MDDISDTTDVELQAVLETLRGLDSSGLRIARVLRDTIDQLYDGQRTGRYRWDQLYKTEKTHCGTLVEINLQREFKFEDGITLDFRIGCIEVDCKYSQKLGGWMIPPEALGHICMLVSAEDSATPTWNFGVVRITANRLGVGGNRDQKKTLNPAGRAAINWLFYKRPLAPNVLLQLDRAVVDRIMAINSGSRRVNELFRHAIGRIVGRSVVATVAQQDDYMKRVRANGGARTTLRAEGIIILGQYSSHALIAIALNMPRPEHGDSISVRLVPAEVSGTGVAEIDGSLWRVAGTDEPAVFAPVLPPV